MDKKQRAAARKQAFVVKLKPFPIQLRAKKGFGRFYTAREPIQAGQTILKEQPLGAVLFQSFCQSHCAYCFSPLKNPIDCPDCKKQTFWCSMDCQARDKKHPKVCNLLSKISGIAGASGADDAIIRLIGCTLAQCFVEIEHLDGILASQDQRTQMVSHPSLATDAWLYAIKTAGKDILDEIDLDVASRLTLDDIVLLAMQINANSFALFDASGTVDGEIGVGIYPFAALCNHSCLPNVHYTSDRFGVLRFIALRDIDAGEEIHDTYIDIYSTFNKRQEQLLVGKNFVCQCLRCLETSPEATMQGKVCTLGHVLNESTCPQGCPINPDSAQDELNVLLAQANDFQQLGDSRSVIRILTLYLEKAKFVYESHHAHLLQVYMTLMNTHLKLGYADQSLLYAQKAFVIMNECGPTVWSEKIDLLVQIGHLQRAVEVCHDTQSDWKSTFNQAIQASTIAYGSSHPKTLSIQGFLNE